MIIKIAIAIAISAFNPTVCKHF